MKKVKLLLAAGIATTILLSACSTKSETKNATVAASDVSKNEETTAEAESFPDVETQVIYDENNIKVTVTGFDQDASSAWLNVLVENNSEKDIIVQARKESVNGYMADFVFSCSVASGKKANDKMSIYTSDLDRCGIGKITDIEFVLCLTDDSFINNTYSDVIHIKRNLPEPFEQTYDDSGDVAFDNGSIKIVTKDLVSDSSSSSFWFYMENNTDKPIVIQCRNTSINGFMVDGSMSCEILPGKKAVDDILVWSSQLEENGIEDIETFDVSFHMTSEDFTETIADSDPITITYVNNQ